MDKGKPYEVGYKRTPKGTRWKKGQCGNPRRIRKPKPMIVAKLIEDALDREVDIYEAGVPRRVTVFAAIVLQLWKKTMEGNSRAFRVIMRYQEFERRRSGTGGIVFQLPARDRYGE
jgi:hypothetical protein